MMIPKITKHAASVVVQNKKDRVRVLGRGSRSKDKRHSPLASLSGSSSTVPAIRLGRRLRTAQTNCNQSYVAHFWKNHYRLLLSYTGMFTLLWKRVEIGRRGKIISFRYCCSFFCQKTWL